MESDDTLEYKPQLTDWQGLKKVGAKRKIKDKQALWELACDYFTHVDSQPIIAVEAIKSGAKAGKCMGVPMQRPYSWKGFDAYLATHKGILKGVSNYRTNKGGVYDEYQDTFDQIGAVMFAQKFEGASVGIFNPSIITTELGLIKRHEVTEVAEQPLFIEDILS